MGCAASTCRSSKSARRRAASLTAFIREDNCGTTYFTIQIKGVNAAGFGDYARRLLAEQHRRCRRRSSAGMLGARRLQSRARATRRGALRSRARSPSVGQTCPAPRASKPSFTKPMNGASSEGLDGRRAQVAVADEPLARGRMSALRRSLARCGAARAGGVRHAAAQERAARHRVADSAEPRGARARRVGRDERPARHDRRRCVDARERAR